MEGAKLLIRYIARRKQVISAGVWYQNPTEQEARWINRDTMIKKYGVS